MRKPSGFILGLILGFAVSAHATSISLGVPDNRDAEVIAAFTNNPAYGRLRNNDGTFAETQVAMVKRHMYGFLLAVVEAERERVRQQNATPITKPTLTEFGG